MGPGMGTGQLGYHILCCTVHTVAGPGTGLGNGTMGCRPIFLYLICVPVMCCNQFQLLCLYIMPFYNCHLLIVTMARTRLIVLKHTKKRQARRITNVCIIFLLWQYQQVFRDMWVHPLNEERTKKGEFYTHYTDHRQFDDRFFELYHMTVAQFDELLYKVGPAIMKKETNFRRPPQPRGKTSNNCQVCLSKCFIILCLQKIEMNVHHRL